MLLYTAILLSLAFQSPPLNSFLCRKVSVTTTAQSVRALLDSTGTKTFKSLSISVPGSTVVCLGGADVDCTTNYEPVCNGSSCPRASRDIEGNGSLVYLRAGSTVDAHICGGDS